MYESHFGITGPPFQLSPDPSFYFDSKGHHQAMAEIRRGLAEKTGFVVISGEVGAGKTTLVRTLLEELDSSRYALGHILNTQLDADELLRAILLAFGVSPQEESPEQWMKAIHRQVAALAKDGWSAVLIIDEAQNLHPDAFHRLVELDRSGTPGRAPLKVFLVGQPELRTLVASPELGTLRERVRVSCHLGPLGAVETGHYIEHRLAKVGWSGVPRFEPGAFAEIHRWTQGIPRRVNLLCNRLMLSRFLSGEVLIDAAMVATTARDLRAEIGDIGPEPEEVQVIEPITLTEVVDEEATEEVSAALQPMAPPSLLEPTAPKAPAEPAAPLEPIALKTLSTPPTPAARKAADKPPPRPAPSPATVVPAPAPVAPVTPPRAAPVSAPAAPAIPAAAAAPTLLRRDRRRPAALPPQLPPVVQRGDGSGPLLFVLNGEADHIKAAALLGAMAGRAELPVAWLVRINASDAVERNLDLFAGFDRSRLINLGLADGTAVGRAAELMKRFEFVVDHCEPAAVVVFDASEVALYAGMVARSKLVPVVHIGAGLRTAEPSARADVNRRLTDQLADLLYTADADAGDTLVREGVAPERVRFVGNLLVDALQAAMRASTDGPEVDDGLGDARQFLTDAHGYGLVTIDAWANVSERQTLTELVTILRQVSRDLPLIWPMHQRTYDQLVKFRLDAFIANERIACVPLQRHASFARLLGSATCALTDSWSVQEEATALGIPCLTMGVEPGRPMAEGVGSGIPVGKNKTLATRAVWECIFNGGKRGRVPDLWDGQAAGRIASHLATWLVAERTRLTV